jgi:hypothetical protein
MKVWIGFTRLFSVLLLTALVTGCGGGGGSGDGGVSTDGSLSISPNSVAFQAERMGSIPANQLIAYSSSNPDASQIIAGFPPGTTPPSWLNLSFYGSNNVSLSITSTDLFVGTFNTTVRVLMARSDDTVIDYKDISVSYTITEATIANPTSIVFNMAEGVEPAMQTITLSNDGNPVTPTDAAIYTGVGRFAVSLNGNSIAVSTTASALSLTPGNYDGSVKIAHAGGTIIVPVLLTVSAKSLTVSSDLSFMIDTSTQLADLTQAVNVGTNYPASGAADWTATAEADKPWISVSPTSGDTQSANAISVSIDPSKLGDLLNRYHNDGQLIDHTAAVTINSTTAGIGPATLTISLNLDYPHAQTVSPNVAVTGSSEEIILRGWGFSELTSQILYCGSQEATSYTVLSDVEIRATCPALTAGDYEMRFENSIGMIRTNPILHVKDAAGYADEVISSTGMKSRIVYDATRDSIYLANTGNGEIERIVYDETISLGSKWVVTVLPITDLVDIALSTDASYLTAMQSTAGGYMTLVDPAALTILEYHVLGGTKVYNNAAFLSGGEAITTYGPSGTSETSTRFKRLAAVGLLDPAIENAVVGATRDGRRALVASKDANPAADVFYHDSASAPTMNPSTMNSTGLTRNASAISSDRRGSKWILDHIDVYTDQFLYLGSLPSTTLASTLNHDGSIAYTVDSSGSLRKFDLTNVSAQQFSEVGSGTTLAGDPGANPVMTLSHDGGKLFIAGDQNVIIQTSP